MSASGTPYIGSKISLVSKAKIRYEGYLYTIDTEESTVTLAKVKSFGTEEREAPNKVPERNEIYEYIVFRGSDIDDLHVAEGPKNNRPAQGQVAQDPAIVQTGNTQPSMYQQQMQMPMQHFPHQSYGPFGGMPPFGYPLGFRPQGTMPLSSVIGPGVGSDRNQRSSPFDRYRQSPSPPSAGVVGSRYQSKEKDEKSRSPEMAHKDERQRESDRSSDNQQSAPKPQREQRNTQRPRENEHHRERNQNKEHDQPRRHSRDGGQQRDRYNQRESEESKTHGRSRDKEQYREKTREEGHYKRHNDGNSRRHIDAKESDNSGRGKSSEEPKGRVDKEKQRQSNDAQKKGANNKEPQQEPARESSGGTNKESTKESSRESSREDYSNSQSSSNERGRPRGRARGRGRGRGSYNNKQRFDKDFDFERSNAKFNKEEVEKELLSALKKNVSLKDEDDVIVEKDGHRDSFSDDIEAEINGEEAYYDKTKSFFDQISCDSSNQPSPEVFTKRKERALNAETFGALPRNYRGRPYRGRGGRGGRGRGYGRGGQRGRGRGGNSNRTWVDYEFDFEAAGIRQGSNSNKSGGS
eukprot:Seg2046.2 transcript_id=Seg2046.2/GoldUCD/mRNA.D3Y31 product="Protein LSM14 B" protein_id=Seg2046.2/GoldUCD/D3Y31